MLKSQHRLFHAIVLSADLVLIAVAFQAGNYLDWSRSVSVSGAAGIESWGQIAALWTCWLFLSHRLNLYQSRRTQDLVQESQALFETWLLSLALGTLICLMLPGPLLFSPLATLLTGLVLIIGCRYPIRLFLRTVRAHGQNYRQTLFVGSGATAKFLARDLLDNPHYGIKIFGSVSFPGEKETPVVGVPQLGDLSQLQSILTDATIDYLIIAPSANARSSDVQEVFYLCDKAGIACHYAPTYFTLQHLFPEVAWYSNMPTIAFRSVPGLPVKLTIKRAIDFLGAALGLVIGSVVMLACAIAIKLHDGGPILYRHTRVGRGGRHFSLYKLRTMCVGAENKQGELEVHNEQDGPVFKIRKDPRITPLGRLLRKYSLDELPQLFNVLRGDMSLVGPRPPTPAEVRQYDWWQRRRLSVRPGLTCIWQVWGRNAVSFDRWMEMDLYYIDNWSLWMDMKLLLRTMPVVARGTGM